MKRTLLYALAVVLLPATTATTSPMPPAVQFDTVQEDWQLVIGTPDTVEQGPQITTCMSPVSDGSTPFVAFDMNYREYPTFQPGGMQLQVWDSGNVTATASQKSQQLNEPGETITWTQQMSYSNSVIQYTVLNGTSDTWDDFGHHDEGENDFAVSFNASVADLTGYSPDVSAKNSGVTWQSNRVTSMTLVQVRYYLAGMLVATDTNARVINLSASQSDPSQGNNGTQSTSPTGQ
jgi:hypothetical protein